MREGTKEGGIDICIQTITTRSVTVQLSIEGKAASLGVRCYQQRYLANQAEIREDWFVRWGWAHL